MKSAKLVIKNNEKFYSDIWTKEGKLSPTDWENARVGFIASLRNLYKRLEMDDSFVEDAEFYALGDVINLLRAIDVEVVE